MIRRALSLGTAILAALVGGCGDGPATVAGGYRNAAAWSSFVYATSRGPLLLEVRGDPFAAGADVLAAIVAESMAIALPARPFALTTDPTAAPHPGFRVVLALGAPAGLDERDLCAGRDWTPAPPVQRGGRIKAMATFCDGQALLSSVRGWVARIEGAGDRRFRQLLGQMARDLLAEPP